MLWWLPFVMRGCSVHMGSHTRLSRVTQVWAARPRTQPIMRTRSSLCVSPGWVSAGVREFSFHHNITSKHWQSRSRLPSSADNCPFIWSRKLFTNSPGNWKTATVSTQTGFRGGGGVISEVDPKIGIQPVTTVGWDTGWNHFIHEVWRLRESRGQSSQLRPEGGTDHLSLDTPGRPGTRHTINTTQRSEIVKNETNYFE